MHSSGAFPEICIIQNVIPLKKILLYLICAASCILIACSHSERPLVRSSMRQYFDPYRVNGFLAIEDPARESILVSDSSVYTMAFTPASTFKICNSLIALETGVIQDENSVLAWDSVPRQNQEWNKDQSLKEAFQHSTVWYYQELARRIGETRMKQWIDTLHYGNANISGGIDQFWLSGGLRITPQQQIRFLKNLHDEKLPFSKRSMDIVKKMMICRDSNSIVYRGKTGWGSQDKMDIGWFVGYAESPDRVVYFANLVRMADTSDNVELFDRARREVTFKAVDDYFLGTLK
jgi:beta-lactamase class D